MHNQAEITLVVCHCLCRFTSNSVPSTSGTAGGGLYVYGGGSSNFSACTFTNNTSGGGGGMFLVCTMNLQLSTAVRFKSCRQL